MEQRYDVQLEQQRSLGTLAGVFAPVALSMFSTLLFLRIGYIVGNAGLALALALLVLAYIILALTAASLAAIVTSGRIEGGGVYYMISRVMGPRSGTTVGIVFYMANVVGSALFATGCSEGILYNFGYPDGAIYPLLPQGRWIQFGVASGVSAINLIISVVGAGAFGKISLAVLAIVISALGVVYVSFLTDQSYAFTYNVTFPNCTANCSYHTEVGTFEGFAASNRQKIWSLLLSNLLPDPLFDCEDSDVSVSLSGTFSVLFAGVTGIMAGANLSGELKRPAKSIPSGTLTACTFTFFVYATLFALTAATCSRALLYHECRYLTEVSEFRLAVTGASALTTFCASTSGLIGASRVLEALARDGLLYRASEWLLNLKLCQRPVLVSGVTFCLVQCVLLMQSLNKIARLCTLAFLLSYLSVNLATLALSWSAATNFRPTSPAHWSVSLMGALSCLATMIFVDPAWAFGLILASISLYIIQHFWRTPSGGDDWGSVDQGVIYHVARKFLLLLDRRKSHVKHWRPQILLLVSDPVESTSIIQFGNALKKGGLYVLGHVFRGDLELSTETLCPSITGVPGWTELVHRLQIKAFPELAVSRTLREGVQQLIRLSGVGIVKPNIVLIGFKSPKKIIAEEHEGEAMGWDQSRDPLICLDEDDAIIFDKMRWKNELSDSEYCLVLEDITNLGKSLMIHRNFHQFDWDFLPARGNWIGLPLRGSPRSIQYFDIWFINFFAKANNIISDYSCLLMLQMAYVASRKFPGVKLRLFLRENQDVDQVREDVEVLLDEHRLSAEIVFVPVASPQAQDKGVEVPGGEGIGAFSSFSAQPDMGQNTAPGLYDLEELRENYVKQLSRVILEARGGSSCLASFLYLAFPLPLGQSSRYLHLLDLLSQNLGPCLFVHGVETVMATRL